MLYDVMQQKLPIKCLRCKIDCLADSREIKRGRGKFCSISCGVRYNASLKPKPTPNVECAFCHVLFYRNNSRFLKSKSRLFFCCRDHKDRAQRIGGIKEIMPPHYGKGDGIYSYRELAFSHKPEICERCSYVGHKIALVVHHKDRNRKNNVIENLEVLCRNCHEIEHYLNK